MRICFTSDFHGREALYQELDALLIRERPALAILGGDMFPDGDIDDPIGTQVAYIESEFLPRIRRWTQQQPGIRVAVILGNHDWRVSEMALARAEARRELTLLTHRKLARFGELSFFGYSNTPPTPYWVKDFERLDRPDDPIPEMGGAVWDEASGRAVKAEPEQHFRRLPAISKDLAELPAVDGAWVLVAHAPPFDSKLDRLPHLDYPIGSQSVRATITTRQPLLSLHGHIHESPDVTGAFHEMIGGTLCVNPGQSPTRLQAVILDSDHPQTTLRHTVYS